jgi:hypothetical protein
MLYAVTIDALNAIFFVSERPDGDQWEVVEGVSLDAPPVYGIGRPGREQQEQILYVSLSDPKHYKVFINPRDVDSDEFQPAGRHFGGLYSKPSWERFAKIAPSAITTLCTEADEPQGATEEAVAAIKRGS